MKERSANTESAQTTGRPGLFNRQSRNLVAGAVALALAAGGTVVAQVNAPPATAGSAMMAAQGLPSFADVAERVTPAVVNVAVVSERSPQMQMHGMRELPEGTPFNDFLEKFFEQQQGGSASRETHGQGSGFLVDADGHIVTNNHVIDGATEVSVVLNDGSEFKARVLGRDEKTDLALLKIDADHPLPFVDLGDSARARVGDWVLAVGNPFGLGGSVNAGIISARGRDIHSGPYDDYIQIDAPINRGNSGGPLFDAAGQVIGVNAAIYSPTGGNVGIGFAIPAETVRTVVADLRSKGRVDRGWLGLQIQPVTEDIAAGLGMDEASGVLIADVLADGPAAASDLQPGDVILSADGVQLHDYRDLPKLIAARAAGTRVQLGILREGKPRNLELTVGAMPDGDNLAGVPAGSGEDGAQQPRLGLYLAPLTPELRREQGISTDSGGVLVAQVEPNSPAERAGIEPGTLISMVGGHAVTSPDQVIAAVRQAAEEKRDSVVLRVEKDGKPIFVAVPFAA